ncbi:MAG: DASH family cryptochrome [Ferruginibacter sp.]|nr:DASH family cryptochrome [Ferruginibacter sp.]
MKRAVIWFKTDLRLHDNETLNKALDQSDEVIPVYCLDDDHFTTNDFGFKKTGNFRAQFLFESLTDLDRNLHKIGSGLILLKGKPEIEIAKIAKIFNAEKVFAKKESVYEELITQGKVEKELNKINCILEAYSTDTLYHPEDLPFIINDMPNVFTDFRKRVEKSSIIRQLIPKPDFISSPTIEKLQLPDMEDLNLAQAQFDSRAAIDCKGGETEGMKRLHKYLTGTHAIATYKETRNGMIGENYSSKFSAWLAMGCLSPRTVYHEIKKYEQEFIENDSTYWLVFELLWRDFFAFLFKKYPYQYFRYHGINSRERCFNKHDNHLFQKWQNGQTGNDFIDANMLELKYTGWMSNRGRQNTASYLCHDLKLDWRYGAAYFEQQLIDYDVCSNWGNWAYIAGVGNNPRGASVFNIEKQANEYDKDKSYRNLWLNKNQIFET